VEVEPTRRRLHQDPAADQPAEDPRVPNADFSERLGAGRRHSSGGGELAEIPVLASDQKHWANPPNQVPNGTPAGQRAIASLRPRQGSGHASAVKVRANLQGSSPSPQLPPNKPTRTVHFSLAGPHAC